MAAKTKKAFKPTKRGPRPAGGKALRDGCPRKLLDPIEIASRDEIAALQTKRLKWTLAHAYKNVPLYRKKFDAAGVHPSDFKRLEDIAKFPFTTKADLRDAYPFGMFAVPREKCVRVHASSGTTGKPTVVGYTRKDIDDWAKLVARSIRASGGLPGDLLHVAYGYGLFTGGLGAHYGGEALGCTVIPMSGGQTEKQVQLILDFKPQLIMVTPSYMLAIADEFEKQGHDPRKASLLVGIHGAEPWTDQMRKEIEARFAMDAVDIYGLSEDQGRSDDLGGPFPAGDRRPGHDRTDGRRKHGRVGVHHAHQGSAAGDPLSHARPDRAVAGHGAQHAPDGPHHRPIGRHDDRARGERVPHPDRGVDPQAAGAVAALRTRAAPRRAARHARHRRRAQARARRRPRRPRRGGRGVGSRGEGLYRRQRRGDDRRTRKGRALGRQGQARHRSAPAGLTQ
jgi:hypothetical protein